MRFYGIETVEKNKYKNQYYACENGLNSRLDEVQATILNFKLNKVDSFISKRRSLAKKYMTKLANTSLRLPVEKPDCKHVYHLFTVYHPKGEAIKKILLNKKTDKFNICRSGSVVLQGLIIIDANPVLVHV